MGVLNLTNVPVNTSGDGVEKSLRIPGGKRGDFGWKHAGPEREWSKIGVIEADGVDFASFGHNDLVAMQGDKSQWVANGKFM